MFMAQLLKAMAMDPLSDYGKTAPLNKPNDTRVVRSIAVSINRRRYMEWGTKQGHLHLHAPLHEVGNNWLRYTKWWTKQGHLHLQAPLHEVGQQ